MEGDWCYEQLAEEQKIDAYIVEQRRLVGGILVQSPENPPAASGHGLSHSVNTSKTSTTTVMTANQSADIQAFMGSEQRNFDSKERQRPCTIGASCPGRTDGKCGNRHYCKFGLEKCRASNCNLEHYDRFGKLMHKNRDNNYGGGGNKPNRPNGGGGNNPPIIPPGGGGLNPPINPPIQQQQPNLAMTFDQAVNLDMPAQDEATIQIANKTIKAGKEWKDMVKKPETDPFDDMEIHNRKHEPRIFLKCIRFCLLLTFHVACLAIPQFSFVYSDPFGWFWIEADSFTYTKHVNGSFFDVVVEKPGSFKYPYWAWFFTVFWALKIAYGIEQIFCGYAEDLAKDAKEYYSGDFSQNASLFIPFFNFSIDLPFNIPLFLSEDPTFDPPSRHGANIVDLPRDIKGATFTTGLDWLNYPTQMSSHFEFPIGLCYFLSSKISRFHTASSQFPMIGAYIRTWCKEHHVGGDDQCYFIIMAAEYLKPEGEIWPKISQT